MRTESVTIPVEPIAQLTRVIRGQRVILGSDLAKIYGVVGWRLNEQVKRNRDRFPDDFVFQLNRKEAQALTSQNARSKPGRGGRRTLPYAFTEHGAFMVANVLKSPRAVQMSVFVVRAFVKLREALAQNKELATKLLDLERTLTARLDGHEKAIIHILKEIKKLMEPPAEAAPTRRAIGFHVRDTVQKAGSRSRGFSKGNAR